jgi:hypothetical protein
MNNSASGGYLVQGTKPVLPQGLNLTQFIQTVLAGISGVDGALIRPKWQPDPPKQPENNVDWIAFAYVSSTPNANSYIAMRPDGSTISQRHERLEVQCAFYGPNNYEIATGLRDGFQVQQNLAALKSAHMGFTEVGPANRIPDLVNERWIDKIEMSVYLQREIQRVYPILSFLSADGTIKAFQGNEGFLIDWSAQN